MWIPLRVLFLIAVNFMIMLKQVIIIKLMTDDKRSSAILRKFSLAATFPRRLSGAEVKFKAFLSLEMVVSDRLKRKLN